jgi:hypothetical protein
MCTGNCTEGSNPSLSAKINDDSIHSLSSIVVSDSNPGRLVTPRARWFEPEWKLQRSGSFHGGPRCLRQQATREARSASLPLRKNYRRLDSFLVEHRRVGFEPGSSGDAKSPVVRTELESSTQWRIPMRTTVLAQRATREARSASLPLRPREVTTLDIHTTLGFDPNCNVQRSGTLQ